MSMKFFAGLQDFFGLYETSSSSSEQQQRDEQQLASPASTTATTSAAVVTVAAAAATASSTLLLRPSVLSVDSDSNESEGDSLKYISDISNSRTAVQQHEQQPLLQQIKLDGAKEITDAEDKIRHCSHKRSVHFPDVIVTDFYDAPANVSISENTNDTSAISVSYLNACKRLRVDPIQAVQEQIACFHQVVGVRQECLTLKGRRLSSTDMECLEEIFSKVQFDMLDFEYTFLDDDCAVCLGEMLEFYDSAIKLNLSFNKQINLRGWQAICKAIRDAPSLQYLNLRYTSLSDRAVPMLARALRSQCSLTVLHLENVSLSGRNLILIGCALKGNTVLRELYLGDNNLQPADGAHIYQIIVTNASIQLLDLRNNQLQDGGLRHICDALRHRDTAKNSALSALVLWNNRLTSSGMEALAQALMESSKLETLNIGSNNLLLEGIVKLKPALQHNCSLQRLGLQATNLDCQSAIVLAECLADNKIMVRLDLRDNPHIGSAGLLALHLAMKMNTSLAVLNLDVSIAQSSSMKVKEYQEQFEVYYEEIKMFCERNKQLALKKLSVLTAVEDGTVATNVACNEDSVDIEKDEEKENEEKNRDAKLTKDGQINNSEFPQRNLTTTTIPVWLLGRSSSLTCAETIDDISDRVVQMSHHSLSTREPIPDSTTTIKKQSDESHPSLLSKSELLKYPSLPSIPTRDYLESGVCPPGRRISRRFTVSTSNLNDANPRDVARTKSRFKVEHVGPSVQAKAKSDEHTSSYRSLSESFAEDTLLDVKNLAVERPKKAEDSEFVNIDELARECGSRAGKESVKCTLLHVAQGKNESCHTRNAIKSSDEGMVTREQLAEESSRSDSVQFSTIGVVGYKPETLPTWDDFEHATFVGKSADSVSLKLDAEEYSSCEQVIGTRHPIKQSQQKLTNDRGSAVLKSERAFSNRSAIEDGSGDTNIVQEVIRDLINYVVYEVSDKDPVYNQNFSSVTRSSSSESIPTARSLSLFSRSSSSSTLNSLHDIETDEDVVRSVVRGLVRNILLQEKELLRRSLRKKRRQIK